MKSGEVGKSTLAICFSGPYYRQRRDKVQRLPNLERILCILYQFHDYETGNGGHFRKAGEPCQSRRMTSLNIDENIAVEQIHGTRDACFSIPVFAVLRCGVLYARVPDCPGCL